MRLENGIEAGKYFCSMTVGILKVFLARQRKRLCVRVAHFNVPLSSA